MKCRGLSLLEVMLALAILGGSMAAITQLVRLGAHGAVDARELTTAQLLCEAKLAEITAGVIPPDPGGPWEFEMPEHAEWRYYVDVQPLPQPGLIQLSVSVNQEKLDGRAGMGFSLVRWMKDPAVELAEPETEAPAEDPAATGATNSTDAANSAGAAANPGGGGAGGQQGGGAGGGFNGGQGGGGQPGGGGRGGPGGGRGGAGGQQPGGGGRGGPGGGRGGPGGGRGGPGGGQQGGGGRGGAGGGQPGGGGGGFGGFGGGQQGGGGGGRSGGR